VRLRNEPSSGRLKVPRMDVGCPWAVLIAIQTRLESGLGGAPYKRDHQAEPLQVATIMIHPCTLDVMSLRVTKSP
jgi:hypothetical protein